MINVKSRNYDQLLNYKKFLTNDVKESMCESQKYILAIRDQDLTQEMDSGGSANQARRDHFQKKNNQILEQFLDLKIILKKIFLINIC